MAHLTRWIGGAGPAAIIALGLMVASPAIARAHEEGVLRPASRTLTAGDSLALAGFKFGKSAPLKIALVGLGGRFALGEVRTDSAGAFDIRVLVPEGAAAGSYRLVAIASDGDEVAGVDVAVTPPAAEPAGAHADGTHGAVDMPDAPSAEPLPLVTARSSLVTFGTVAAIVFALMLAVGLLRSARTSVSLG